MEYFKYSFNRIINIFFAKTRFQNIFNSKFSLPNKVYILAPGPNGRKSYNNIPSESVIIAVNKAVLIPGIQADIWMLNFLTPGVLEWYDEADSRFSGTRIFRKEAINHLPNYKSQGYFFPVLKGANEKLSENGIKSIDGVIRPGVTISGLAIQLAYNFGAKEIILCGVDMSGFEYWDGSSYPHTKHGSTWEYTGRLNNLIRLLLNKGISIYSISPTMLNIKEI